LIYKTLKKSFDTILEKGNGEIGFETDLRLTKE
jgi:hypothetical protein